MCKKGVVSLSNGLLTVRIPVVAFSVNFSAAKKRRKILNFYTIIESKINKSVFYVNKKKCIFLAILNKKGFPI